MYCSDMLLLEFSPRSLVEQCLNTVCQRYSAVLLREPWLIEQLPVAIQQRLQLRSRLLLEAQINAVRARPVPSQTVTCLADIFAL